MTNTPSASERDEIYAALILNSVSVAAGEPECRLSGEHTGFTARARHAVGSRSSDGSGTPNLWPQLKEGDEGSAMPTARAAGLRPQPASQSSQSSIPIAESNHGNQ